MINDKNYNFLDCDWFEKLLFSTNSLAKLLSDSLLFDSLLSDSSISQSLSKLFLWIIVNYYHSKGKLAETDIKCEYSHGERYLNIEELCRAMWGASENKWVTHTCKTEDGGVLRRICYN